jgi:two-component system chemotaxis response regulator CheB
MPPTFTTILAEHITRSTGCAAAEAVDREAVQPNRVYVAPGDFHMVIEVPSGGGRILRLTKEPPENFCRPSVDPMLRSLAQSYGRRLTCVILTGMGQDGLRGGEAVIAAGGTLLAQDEATSVVWGMPGAVTNAGLCSAVLPLAEIAPYLCKLAMRPAA